MKNTCLLILLTGLIASCKTLNISKITFDKADTRRAYEETIKSIEVSDRDSVYLFGIEKSEFHEINSGISERSIFSDPEILLKLNDLSNEAIYIITSVQTKMKIINYISKDQIIERSYHIRNNMNYFAKNIDLAYLQSQIERDYSFPDSISISVFKLNSPEEIELLGQGNSLIQICKEHLMNMDSTEIFEVNENYLAFYSKKESYSIEVINIYKIIREINYEIDNLEKQITLLQLINNKVIPDYNTLNNLQVEMNSKLNDILKFETFLEKKLELLINKVSTK